MGPAGLASPSPSSLPPSIKSCPPLAAGRKEHHFLLPFPTLKGGLGLYFLKDIHAFLSRDSPARVPVVLSRTVRLLHAWAVPPRRAPPRGDYRLRSRRSAHDVCRDAALSRHPRGHGR